MIPRNVFEACQNESMNSKLENRLTRIIEISQEDFDKIDCELARYKSDTWSLFPTLLGVPLKIKK